MTYQDCMAKAEETLACMETLTPTERDLAVKEIWREYLSRFPSSPTPPSSVQIERHGIVWTLEGVTDRGSFANGDPWVNVGAKITAISPSPELVSSKNPVTGAPMQRAVNGTEISPSPHGFECGYDGAARAQNTLLYRSERNAGLRLPISLSEPMSVVSTRSHKEPGVRPQILEASVLTAVAEPASVAVFRPPYIRGVPRVSVPVAPAAWPVALPTSATFPSERSLAENVERLWLDQMPDWPGRELHPSSSMPDYGRDLCALYGLAALASIYMRSSILRMHLTQIGLDAAALLTADPDHHPAGGGHGSGRKFMVLYAAWSAGDMGIAACLKRPRAGLADPSCVHINEDDQTFVVEETEPGSINYGQGGYTREDLGMVGWGGQHWKQIRRGQAPTFDDKRWPHQGGRDGYRTCCTANAWLAQTIVTRMLGLEGEWDHPPYFAWMDQYVELMTGWVAEGKYASWQLCWPVREAGESTVALDIWRETNGGKLGA